ncbi:hypothetical protein BC835DRAFT_1281621 [Cytidiella melzeri]|nr:hypothetical protein BC835DRAFT_1281621 [Cytidiella melzeri]
MPTQRERTKRVGHATKEFFIGGKHLCCCIPTRFGVILGSLLMFLVSGALAVVLWFEVSTEQNMSFSSTARTYVTLGGLLETLVCLVSVIGFIGGIVRKQLFITIYAYFLYSHFLINLGAGTYLLWLINHTADVDITVACERTIKDPGTQADCSKLLNDFRGVFNGLIVFTLLIELYGTLIVTRYMRQLKTEKRVANFAADEFRLRPHYYTSLEDDDRENSPFDSSYRPPSLSRFSATHFPVMPEGYTPPSPEHKKGTYSNE